MIKLGMHTDNWRTLSGSFEDAVASARENKLECIEFAVIDGQELIQALGYAPSLPMDCNVVRLRRYLEENGLQVSQIDAGFPISGPKGSTFGVLYAQRAIRFAKELGCPRVDLTDGAHLAEGYTKQELLAITKQNLRQIVEMAIDYEIVINLEPHGPFTTTKESMEELLNVIDTPYLGMNFDTGNTMIAGLDPVNYLEHFIKKVNHFHIKDVTQSLLDAVRGQWTGIPVSACTIGEGVNADNIRRCIEMLKKIKWDGVLSIETEGTPERIRGSINWLRNIIG